MLEDADHRGGDRGACDIADGRVLADRRHDELGRGERARPERAHELRCRVGLARARGAESIDERGQQLVRRLGSDLELDLAEASSDALAVEHRHLVVRDLGDALPLGSKSAALRRSVWRRATGVNVADRTYARNELERRGRDLGRQAHEVVLGPSEHAVLGLAGKLHRPDPTAGLGAIPDARAPTDQTEIGRVPIRRVERDVGARARRHRREHAIELGEDEPRPGGELRLALDPAVRLRAAHARARLSASSCSRRCASLWWTVGTRCHPPSASSSQASTSSVRLTSSTS